MTDAKLEDMANAVSREIAVQTNPTEEDRLRAKVDVLEMALKSKDALISKTEDALAQANVQIASLKAHQATLVNDLIGRLQSHQTEVLPVHQEVKPTPSNSLASVFETCGGFFKYGDKVSEIHKFSEQLSNILETLRTASGNLFSYETNTWERPDFYQSISGHLSKDCPAKLFEIRFVKGHGKASSEKSTVLYVASIMGKYFLQSGPFPRGITPTAFINKTADWQSGIFWTEGSGTKMKYDFSSNKNSSLVMRGAYDSLDDLVTEILSEHLSKVINFNDIHNMAQTIKRDVLNKPTQHGRYIGRGYKM